MDPVEPDFLFDRALFQFLKAWLQLPCHLQQLIRTGPYPSGVWLTPEFAA